MSVTLSARTLSIRSQPMAEPVAGRSRALSMSWVSTRKREVIPRAPGPRGEHRTRGAENNIEGPRPDPEVPGLTHENLRSLEGRDPMAAALLSVVSSLPPSETALLPAFEKVSNAKVRSWWKAGRKEEEAAMAPMFGITWGEEFEVPYGECDASESVHPSNWETDWMSREHTRAKEPGCKERGPSPRGVFPEPVCVQRGLPPRLAAPKVGLDETMELLSRVLGPGEEDPDLSAWSAALKAKLGLSNSKIPPPTLSPGVKLLTMDVKSCRGIRSSPMDNCPGPFHPGVRTVPVCIVGDTTEAEMKGYGLAALAPLATVYPSPASGGTGDPGVPGRETKVIATVNLQIEVPELDPKKLPDWAEEFSESLLFTGQQHADVRTKCTLIKKSSKK